MNRKFVQTANVVNLVTAIGALEKRDNDVPGLGLVFGRAGLGKTKSLTWYAVNYNAFYVRADALWTPKWMLQDICRELGEIPFPRTQQIHDQVLQLLHQKNKPLIIDEADYLLRDSQMLDTVRDLHDHTSIPIILSGMDEISGRLARHRQHWSRISQTVEFLPLTPPEIMLLTKEWTGLKIEPTAAELLVKHTDGDFRLVTICLYHAERMAQTNTVQIIDSALVDTLTKKVIVRRIKSKAGIN